MTAVQQEVTRAHKADRWSLDGVVLHTEVTVDHFVDVMSICRPLIILSPEQSSFMVCSVPFLSPWRKNS